MKEEKDGVKTTINIYGGNNQIQPNVTKADMVFYGDQFVPQEFRNQSPSSPETAAPAKADSQSALEESDEDARKDQAISNLKLHITDGAKLEGYLKQLRICDTATRLASVVVTMHHEVGWPDDVEICKERFINDMKLLAPRLTKGNTVSNIRARIKAVK